MKKLLFIAFGALITYNVQAQIDRSKPPKPGPAPEIRIKDPEIFTLPNGMTVIVVENHKLPQVNATLSIDRGPIREGDKAGVMSMMGQMLSEGTKTMSKATFDKEVDLIGANVNLFSSGGAVSALTRYFNKAFLLMADALKNPAFPQESFDKLKTQAITALKSSEKSASSIASRVNQALSYGKHTAMGEFETEETINALTLKDVKEAYDMYITPSRSYLTFVGDITPGAARNIAMQAFGDWKGRKLTLPTIPDVPNVEKTEINIVDVPTSVQGVINVGNLINNPMSNPDYHALLITNQILGGGSESKLFMNLREKHGFTYGSYSSIGNGRFQSRFNASAQVRSEKADSAIVEMLNEIENMRKGNITEEELAIAKAKYNGSFALGMEDPARAASYATNILINNLPKDFYRTFLQKINQVTVADVKRVSNKYLNKDNSRIVIVGNAEKILPNLNRLGFPIKHFDKYANPVTPESNEVAMDESEKTTEPVSAASIIDKYLTAIGSKEDLKKINSIKHSFTMDMMGQTLTGTGVQMHPNLRKTEIKMGDMVVMQQVFDGKKGFTAQMGQKMDLSEDEVKERLDEKAIIPQLHYITNDYSTAYLGTGRVNGEGAYKLKVTKPSGKVVVEYYSIKTGLLLREESTISIGKEEMTQMTDYGNYKAVGKFMMPYKITQSVGEQEMVMEISEYKINEGVTAADFK